MKTSLPIFLAILFLSGCASSKKVLIVDESGYPITGAGVTPYPILPFGTGNQTGENGIIYVYDIDQESYQVTAKGYKSRELSFTDFEAGRIVLKKQKFITSRAR